MRDTVLVPTAALQRSPQSIFVYVLKWDQTVEIRNVAVGATQGDTSAITAGLDPGELVVVNGAHRLRRGSRVNVQLATDSLALGAVIRPMALLEGPPSKSFAKANAKIP